MDTQNIKTLLSALFQTLSTALDADKNRDGKVSWTERIAIIMPLALSFDQIADAIPNVGAELRDLTDEEMADLVDFIQDELELNAEHQELEAIIELALEAIGTNYTLVRRFKAALEA